MCAKQKNSTGAILIMLLSVIIGMFMIGQYSCQHRHSNIGDGDEHHECNDSMGGICIYACAGRSNTTFGLDDGSFWL